jgi:hypothetical protein
MPDPTQPPRRFPPPWTVEEATESFCIRDANGQVLAYVYFEDEPQRHSIKRGAPVRLIAINIAKLPVLLKRGLSLGRLPTLHERITPPCILRQMDHPLFAA